ncbi:MAG: sugar nucleotide-binding protein [Desulfobacteraceae bacterium]|jgi:dTDP-4-dehydrorhamnose reductase|nr:sugar nucleotide-binding protein [Desulfobacteraceae bacterium]
MFDPTKMLFTGGSGLLGGEVKQLVPESFYPTTSEFDVTDFEQMEKFISDKDISLILHAAAFTSPPVIDKDPQKALAVNIIGTANIVQLCMKRNIRLIYISTDYVFNGDQGNYKEEDPVFPVNKYAWSKLGGECAVRLYDNSLIVRTSFGPNNFPFEKAFADQWTSRECARDIAAKIVSVLDKDITGTLHIGAPRRTVLDYARSLTGDDSVKPLFRNEVSFHVPADTSLDCGRYDASIGKEK